MTNFNERTNTLLYKNIISHILFSKGWCWLCVRGEVETGTECYILAPKFWPQQLFFLILAGLLNRGSAEGPKAVSLPLTLNLASCLQLIPSPTNSSRLCPGYIFLFDAQLLLRFLRLFTQMHLLIDSSMEGQYVTIRKSRTSEISRVLITR